MKSQPWISVLTWVVLMSGAVGQAWCQPKCAPGVIYRCAPDAGLDKSRADSVESVATGGSTCQQTGWNVDKALASREPKASLKSVQKGPVSWRPKSAVGCEPICGCGIGHAQKKVPCEPHKGFTTAEPRRLALPHGSYKRLKTCDTPKAPSTCVSEKCDPCPTDCRHDTIFGTEAIFGDLTLRPFCDLHPCPYERSGGSRPKSLVQVFSKLDASLQKVFVCHRGTCGNSNCKGSGDCQSKSTGKCDKGTAPILEGQPEEFEPEGNPFHDDAVEPAPLPPMPQVTSAASDASQVRPSLPPVKLGVVHARLVSSYSAPPIRQVDPLTIGARTRQPQSIPEQAPSTKSATPLLTSTQLD